MNSGGYPSQKQLYEENKAKENDKKVDPTDIEMAREQVRQQLKQGLLEEQFVEIEVNDTRRATSST